MNLYLKQQVARAKCLCPSDTNICAEKVYEPFASISRQWIVQVEYRPASNNQYFGSYSNQNSTSCNSNLKKVCKFGC